MQEKIEKLENQIAELQTTIASLETDTDATEVRALLGLLGLFVRCVCVIFGVYWQDKITKMNAKIIELEDANATLGTGGDTSEVRCALVWSVWSVWSVWCVWCVWCVCDLDLAFLADEGGVRENDCRAEGEYWEAEEGGCDVVLL